MVCLVNYITGNEIKAGGGRDDWRGSGLECYGVVGSDSERMRVHNYINYE